MIVPRPDIWPTPLAGVHRRGWASHILAHGKRLGSGRFLWISSGMSWDES